MTNKKRTSESDRFGGFVFYKGEDLTSFGHGWKPQGPNPGDVGGDFTLVRYSTKIGPSSKEKEYKSSLGTTTKMPQFAMFQGGSAKSTFHATIGADTDANLYLKGATAIARCIPTNPTADLAQMIGELRRDGLPSIPDLHFLGRAKTTTAKKFGDEYLNYDFGWRPLVSDLIKLAHAVKYSNRILKQYERDSGRLVRRGYRFPTTTTTVSSKVTPAQPKPALLGQYYSSLGYPITIDLVTTTTTKSWFAGAFTYYLAHGKSVLSKMERFEQEANKLLGIRITPEVIWDLQPWSWAVDWYGNIGDVFHNVSAFSRDGLVMRYGYMMEHKTITNSFALSGASYFSSPGPHTFTQDFISESKVRRRASPYGFGVEAASLTARRVATIAALGFSRSGSK